MGVKFNPFTSNLDIVASTATDNDAIHDNVASEISAISSKATPVSGDILLIEDSEDSNNKKKITVGDLPTGGGGEANTASNVGTAGVGVYKQKTGVDIELKKINAGSNKVTITDDTGNDEIDVDVDETNIDHNNLTNYDVGEHRTINDAGTATTDLWSASKINTELSGKASTSHTHTESDITDLQSYLLDITGEALSSLSDVTITAIASGELLKWNGTGWINNTLAEAGISATGHSHTLSDVTDSGSLAAQNTVNNADWSGTDLAVANGGTGASDASGARTNLGLVIGTNVQAHSAVLDATTASFTTTDETKLDGIEASADVTDEANVTDALDGAVLTDLGTPASGDLILLQDASDSNNLKVAQYSTFGGGSSPLTTKGDIYTYSTADARLGVGSNGQILSADSTETTGLKWITAPSAGDMSTISVYDTTGGQTFTTSFSTVNLDTISNSSSYDSSNYSLATDQITITDAGQYKIEYQVSGDLAGGTRSGLIAKLQIDTGGGYADIPGTERAMYGRIIGEYMGTAAGSIIVDVGAGDKIKLVAAGTTQSFTSMADGSAMVITKMTGAKGDTGATGEGVPAGGTTGQVLAKASATDYDDAWITLDPDDLDDTSTTNKFTTAAEISKLAGIEASADVTDEANVTSALSGATLTSVTATATDKVLIQDTSDTDNLKTVSAGILAKTAPTGDVVGTSDTQTLTNKVLTSPNIDVIEDTNGNDSITIEANASAVNGIMVRNSATGSPVSIFPYGSDSNVPISVNAKGNAVTRIKVVRKNISTASYNADTMIQIGWLYITGTDIAYVSSSVSFPITFGEVPVISLQYNGYMTGGTPTALGQDNNGGNTVGNTFPTAVRAPSTSGFTARACRMDGGYIYTTDDVMLSWIAIGYA